MKKINYLILFIAATVCCIAFPMNVAAIPLPQYSSNDDTAGRTYTGHFIEDGKLKNTLIVIKLRRLRSYWNGVEWVECTSKMEKNKAGKDLPEDASQEDKFLAKFPYFVTIENKRVYFDPQEK